MISRVFMLKGILNRFKAKSKIGNNSNNNQVYQNSNVNVNNIAFYDQQRLLGVLKDTKAFDAVQKLTKQYFEDVKQTHPLYPEFSARFNSNLERLISNPETDDALKKYPKKFKSTLKLDFNKYPYMDKNETPWEYAYRTQTPIELETLAYKEYLGDIEDPFPAMEYQEGLMSRIDPPPFPPAKLAKIICGDGCIQTMLKRVPCMEFGKWKFENESDNTPFGLSFTIDISTLKCAVTFSRNYDCKLKQQLARERLLNNLRNHSLRIIIEEQEALKTSIDDEWKESEFLTITPAMLNLLEKLVFIEDQLHFEFKEGRITEIDEEIQRVWIPLLVNSIKGTYSVQQLASDSFRSNYYTIEKTIHLEKDKDYLLEGEIKDFYIDILGTRIMSDKYTMVYKNARINNKDSVKKRIKKKDDRILISLKPLYKDKLIEKYTILHGLRIE